MTNFKKSDSIAKKFEVKKIEAKTNLWNWKIGGFLYFVTDTIANGIIIENARNGRVKEAKYDPNAPNNPIAKIKACPDFDISLTIQESGTYFIHIWETKRHLDIFNLQIHDDKFA